MNGKYQLKSWKIDSARSEANSLTYWSQIFLISYTFLMRSIISELIIVIWIENSMKDVDLSSFTLVDENMKFILSNIWISKETANNSLNRFLDHHLWLIVYRSNDRILLMRYDCICFSVLLYSLQCSLPWLTVVDER